MKQVSLANTQLIARCSYNQRTGKVTFEDFESYYTTPAIKKKRLFK